MPLTFRKLEVFVAAAAAGNFRRTADRLGISQPSVSAQIRDIEEFLGYQLFVRRRGTSAVLSAKGSDFLGRARALVEAEGSLACAREAVRRAQTTIVRVCVGPLLLETRVKPGLAEFNQRYPDLAIDFLPFNPSSDGEQAIRSGGIDVLMYTGGPPERLRSHTEIITRVTCSLYASPELAQSIDQSIAAADAELSSVPFMLPPKHYCISQWFHAQLAKSGIRPRNIVARPPYMDVALQMAIGSKGIAVLFDEHAAASVERGQLCAVRASSIRAFRVMVLGRRALRPEMTPAVEFLRTVAGAEPRAGADSPDASQWALDSGLARSQVRA